MSTDPVMAVSQEETNWWKTISQKMDVWPIFADWLDEHNKPQLAEIMRAYLTAPENPVFRFAADLLSEMVKQLWTYPRAFQRDDDEEDWEQIYAQVAIDGDVIQLRMMYDRPKIQMAFDGLRLVADQDYLFHAGQLLDHAFRLINRHPEEVPQTFRTRRFVFPGAERSVATVLPIDPAIFRQNKDLAMVKEAIDIAADMRRTLQGAVQSLNEQINRPALIYGLDRCVTIRCSSVVDACRMSHDHREWDAMGHVDRIIASAARERIGSAYTFRPQYDPPIYFIDTV